MTKRYLGLFVAVFAVAAFVIGLLSFGNAGVVQQLEPRPAVSVPGDWPEPPIREPTQQVTAPSGGLPGGISGGGESGLNPPGISITPGNNSQPGVGGGSQGSGTPGAGQGQQAGSESSSRPNRPSRPRPGGQRPVDPPPAQPAPGRPPRANRR